MEASGAPSKKRKTAELVPVEAANPAADERGPEPAEEDQDGGAAKDCISELPGADGGAAKTTHISELPDAVLQYIISLLTTKEGARTQLLASGWRNLWGSAPLNIDHHFWRSIDGKNLADVVSRILSAHTGPCRHFSTPVYHLHGDRPATADAWLGSPALRNLEELELCGFQSGSHTWPRPSPVAAFRFSETLVVATFGNCNFPDIKAQTIHFPNLKKLALECVSVSESSLHAVISGCLVLECLLIEYSDGFRSLTINSITLRSMCVKSYSGKLIIQNAPCLERLLQLISYDPDTSVVSAVPKLETLGILSGHYNTRFALGSTVIQGLIVDTLTEKVRTVKILSVDMGFLNLHTTIKLMTFFPCLERLYIKCAVQGEPNLWQKRYRVLLKSFDIRLKKISWGYYGGTKSNVSFATFFVENARVLELMTFQVDRKHYNEKYFAQQCKALQLDSRASEGARFRFTPHNSHGDGTDFRLHDLDLADPFERKDPDPYEFHDL